ncbi:MAG: STAS/SEC14 domain-containing protein [Betaproteobacteria bacterium]
MLDYSILDPEGVLVLKPDAPLKQEDFAGLSATVDAYLAKHETLHGVLAYAKSFPGWEGVKGFTAHMQFVRKHRTKVGRIAVVTDSVVADVVESIAKFFTPAEVKRFDFAEYDSALAWVKA